MNNAIKRSRLLYNLIVKKNACSVVDDETYVKMDFKTLPGPQFFTKSQSQILPEELTQRSGKIRPKNIGLPGNL